MQKIIYLSIIFCLCLAPFYNHAQTLKQYQKAATKAEERMDYSEALANYEVIINDAGKETDANFYRAAENARMMRIFPLAEMYYEKILAGEDAATYPLTDYWLGHVKKRMEKYDAAITHFNNYLNGSGLAGGEKSDRARKEIDDCTWAVNRTEVEDPLLLTHLDNKVNSPYTEMAPVLYGDQLYFSSLRENVTNYMVCESPVTRLYVADKKGTEMAKDTFNFNEGGTNVAHTAFGKDGQRIYYTVCDSKNTNKNSTNCQIYYRQKQNDNSWGQAMSLPATINLPGYNTTQPSIGMDNEDKEVLYFASNRPGGQGKLDLWYSEMNDNGNFDEPVNLTELNTAEDEVTPFFDNHYQALYFSSEGHQNLGGFDIYRAPKSGDGFASFNHTGYPLNTGSDEIYYSTNFEGGKSYFVSNRPGGICADTSQYCVCNDIYMIDNPAIQVKVLTFNEITGEPLFGTEVTLSSLINTDLEVQVKSLADNNLYEDYQVDFSNQYQVVATKEKYTTGNIEFGTPGPLRDTIIEARVYLRPAVDLEVLTFDKLSGDPLNGVEILLVEMTEDKMIAKEMEAFSHEYEYDVNWKKRYMVIGTKDGYTPDTAYVTTEGIPVIPTNLSENLFLCRNISGFNDVVLYFDNDEPEPDNMRTTTNINYQTAYKKYVNDYDNKQGYYTSPQTHTGNMDGFFANEVKNGFNNLEALAAKILEYFETAEGDANVKITIRGYASLRSNPAYNKALTKRRISSIDNFFNNWSDTATNKTLKNYQNRIIVTTAPLGDEAACKGCYKKGAITNVSAAKDRRVEIINVTITKDPCQDK